MPTPQGLQASFCFDGQAPATAAGDFPYLSAWAPEHWPVSDDWHPVVDGFLASDTARQLGQFMRARLASGAIIYPPQPFRALALTPLARVKVLILGQDPYHGPGQAEGLAFSVAPGVKPPPSLRNIFKEIARDPLLDHGALRTPGDGSLVRWARQGVLLLNTCLTVEEGQPASHAQRGWEVLTDAIVNAVSQNANRVVFMLWGAHAQTKQALIESSGTSISHANSNQLILTANHPSPLSAMRPPKPFLGCDHFGLANAFLQQHGCSPVDW